MLSSQSWTTQTWTANDRDDSQLGADYVGIRIAYQYTFITGFIAASGSVLNLSATSVQRIEPQDYGAGMRGVPVPRTAFSSDPLAWASHWVGDWPALAGLVPEWPIWSRPAGAKGTV
jgi:hypothetical protein